MQLLKVSGSGLAHCPDSANLSIADNLDIRIRAIVSEHAAGTVQTFVAKRQGGDEYQFRLNETGFLEFVWWDTGGVLTSEVSSVAPSGEQTLQWYRVRRAGSSVFFYTSTTDTDDHTAATFVQLGSTQTTPSGSIRGTVATHVTVGAAGLGQNEPLYGFISTVAILDNTTVRADPRFYLDTEWAVGEDSGDTASDGVNTWTIGGSAKIVGDNIVETELDVRVDVEMAFDSNPWDASLIWTDITDDVETLSFNRGRQFELDRVDVGTAELQLDNWHGRYNPNNTTSPYYPNVKPMVPIRIRAVYEGTIYPLWQGFVERWPFSFPGNVEAKVHIQCADLFKSLSFAEVNEGRIGKVEELSPVAWWRFTGSGTDDSSSSGTHDLTFAGTPATGSVGAWDGDEAVTFDGTNDDATVANEADVERQDVDRSWECWVRPTGTGNDHVFAVTDNPATNAGRLLTLKWLGGGWSVTGPLVNGFQLVLFFLGDIDEWQHIVITDTVGASTTLRVVYLNGVEVGRGGFANPPTLTLVVRIGSEASTAASYFTGDISEIAVYPTVLTQNQVQSLYNAQFDDWATERTDERIEFVLTRPEVGIGVEWLQYDLEQGRSDISGPLTPGDISVLEVVQLAGDTEQGLVFMTADGIVRFQDRHYRTLEQTTPLAVLDETDYLTVYPELDDELIANDIRVDAGEGPVFRAEDATSISEFGRRTMERTIYPADPNEGADAANWLLMLYKEAVTRTASLPFEILPTVPIATILAGELSNRYTLEVPLNGDDLTVDVFLEGIAHTIDLTGRWLVDWRLSPAAASEGFWLLGVAGYSELGETTVLGY